MITEKSQVFCTFIPAASHSNTPIEFLLQLSRTHKGKYTFFHLVKDKYVQYYDHACHFTFIDHAVDYMSKLYIENEARGLHLPTVRVNDKYLKLPLL